MKNVKQNKKNQNWTVTTAKGKEKVFKTERGAMSHAKRHLVQFQIPAILTANCYYWTPSCNASGRRSTERRRETEVSNFVSGLQKTVGDCFDIDFRYEESCTRIYKSAAYEVDGRSTNVTGFIGFFAKRGVILTK